MSNGKQQTPALACSLTDAEYKERRNELRQRLIPHVISHEHTELSLVLVFDDTKVVRSELKDFVDLEQRCCGFLSFIISPTGEQLTLTINGPEGSQSTINTFVAAVARSHASKNDSFKQSLRKGGPVGLGIGIIALLACELPIVLALVGLGSFASVTSALKPPFGVETAVFLVATLVSVVLMAVLARRLLRRNKANAE